MNRKLIRYSIVLCMACSGCGTFSPDGKGDVLQSRAQPISPTLTHADLKSLPAGKGQITAAVYEFKDKTGQYRPSPSNSLSTSVTQGADAILVKALLDSQWFVPVERASLQNILTERKIAQSAEPSNGAPSELTPVSPAQIIIQGTIVSYDSNTHTGGTGARLLGLGASQSFREDKVTVNLRLIDIDDGRVLHSVSASKKIFSRQLNTGIFSYVDVDKILELEAGNSYNEPSHIAITEAIESALINLIAEGILRNTWQLADDSDIEDPAFERFISANEREEFTQNSIAAAEALAEQKEFIRNVRLRLKRARVGLEYHMADIESEKKRKQLAYAKAQAKVRKRNQEALAALNNSQQQNMQSSDTANSQPMAQATNANQRRVTEKNVQILDSIATEQLIARQAQDILNAQASIQIKATQQAHQAALYAQKLILQNQAQQKQVMQQQQEQQQQQVTRQQQQHMMQPQQQQPAQQIIAPASDKKLEALENKTGSLTPPTPENVNGSDTKLVRAQPQGN